MKPLSDFTTPRRLIPLISRHFFPVEHPEPFVCTTGLKNGSRFPFIAHFLSSGLGLAAAAVLAGASEDSVTAGAAFFAVDAVLPCGFGSVLEASATGFAADAFTTAVFAGTSTGFAAFCTGAADTELLAVATFTSVVLVSTGLAAAVLTAAVLAAGAGALFATLGDAPSGCRVSTIFPAAPGVNS